MRVRCINNSTSSISYWSKLASPVEDILQIGKDYDVYGLSLGEPITYEILLDHTEDHTDSFPSYMFKVIDNRLSSFFVFGETERISINRETEVIPFISFPEWANDKLYFENLIDGDEKSKAIFDKYKKLIYLEFRHNDVKEKSIKVEDNFVQCPICLGTWQLENPSFEMCQCPKCRTVFLNPYISDNTSVNKE